MFGGLEDYNHFNLLLPKTEEQILSKLLFHHIVSKLDIKKL